MVISAVSVVGVGFGVPFGLWWWRKQKREERRAAVAEEMMRILGRFAACVPYITFSRKEPERTEISTIEAQLFIEPSRDFNEVMGVAWALFDPEIIEALHPVGVFAQRLAMIGARPGLLHRKGIPSKEVLDFVNQVRNASTMLGVYAMHREPAKARKKEPPPSNQPSETEVIDETGATKPAPTRVAELQSQEEPVPLEEETTQKASEA